MAERNKTKIIVIAGPTASGKSDLAISLAKRFDGEIISADSRQVYRGMDIGTGKVTKAEQKMAKHWLLDVASPRRQYSVAQWRREAKKLVKAIASRSRVPIVAGGTGFYIDSLVYGLTVPDVIPDAELRRKLQKKTAEQLFAQLKKKDPRRAREIDRHNRVRLIRALEIVLTTGKPVPRPGTKKEYDVLYLAVSISMKKLEGRIEKRLDVRLKGGMIAEIQGLRESGVSWRRLENFGLEYRWVARFLQKKISRNEMRDGLLQDSIAYAKRQMTWWKKNEDIVWVTSSAQAKKLTRDFIAQ